MATWSLCGRHAPDKPPTPIYINLDNVLTVEREGDLTTVIMVGGEAVYCRPLHGRGDVGVDVHRRGDR